MAVDLLLDIKRRVEALEAAILPPHVIAELTPEALAAVNEAMRSPPSRIIPIRGDEEPRTRFRVPEPHRTIVPWFAIEDVKPPERVFLMVTGPSGYTGQTEFLILAQYVPFETRPGARWLDEAGDGINGEYGYEVTHWAHRILLPGDLR